MLTRLSVRDIVLIERLDLELDAGMTVLTGETGAGKSILLDALAWHWVRAAMPGSFGPMPKAGRCRLCSN